MPQLLLTIQNLVNLLVKWLDIFGGKDIKTMPIQYTQNPQLVVNKKVATEMGITIPDDVASKAKMIEE